MAKVIASASIYAQLRASCRRRGEEEEEEEEEGEGPGKEEEAEEDQLHGKKPVAVVHMKRQARPYISLWQAFAHHGFEFLFSEAIGMITAWSVACGFFAKSFFKFFWRMHQGLYRLT